MGNLVTFLIIGGIVLVSLYRNYKKSEQEHENRPMIPSESPEDGTLAKKQHAGHYQDTKDRHPKGNATARKMTENRRTILTPDSPASSIPSVSNRHSTSERYFNSTKPSDTGNRFPESVSSRFKNSEDTLSVSASLARSAEQDRVNANLSRQLESGDSMNEESDDFFIRSREEARKAIVWGEILQRKY